MTTSYRVNGCARGRRDEEEGVRDNDTYHMVEGTIGTLFWISGATEEEGAVSFRQ